MAREPHGQVSSKLGEENILSRNHEEVGDQGQESHQFKDESNDEEDVPVILTGEDDEAAERDDNEKEGGDHCVKECTESGSGQR